MIRFDPDLDMFDADVEAIVNPVNCVGVMGAGLALDVRSRFPLCFAAYRREYLARRLAVGKVLPFRQRDSDQPRWILNLPTKFHWRDKSKLDIINLGLQDLAKVISTRAIRSIAIPKLGCGLGGLHWEDVRPLILDALRDVSDQCDIIILGEGS